MTLSLVRQCNEMRIGQIMEEQRNIVITQLICLIVERQAKMVETRSMLRMLSMIVMAQNLKVAELSWKCKLNRSKGKSSC